MKTNSWQFFGTSVPGPKRPEDDFGQDAHAILEVSPSQAIIAVCDGAGSRSHSAEGAQFCVEQALEVFSDQCFGESATALTTDTWPELARKGLRELLERLKEHTLQMELPLREFACTIQLLVIDESRLFHCHVGDGRAAFKIAGEPWQSLMTPFRVGNEAGVTCFLTTRGLFEENPVAYFSSRVVEYEELEGVCLMTDGTEELFFVTVAESEENPLIFSQVNLPFAPALDPLLAMVTPEQKSADLSAFWAEYLTQQPEAIKVNDDKTLVVGKRYYTKSDPCSETNKDEKSC